MYDAAESAPAGAPPLSNAAYNLPSFPKRKRACGTIRRCRNASHDRRALAEPPGSFAEPRDREARRPVSVLRRIEHVDKPVAFEGGIERDVEKAAVRRRRQVRIGQREGGFDRFLREARILPDSPAQFVGREHVHLATPSANDDQTVAAEGDRARRLDGVRHEIESKPHAVGGGLHPRLRAA